MNVEGFGKQPQGPGRQPLNSKPRLWGDEGRKIDTSERRHGAQLMGNKWADSKEDCAERKSSCAFIHFESQEEARAQLMGNKGADSKEDCAERSGWTKSSYRHRKSEEEFIR
ncbi:hypothetical protein Q3G72_004355 [Acer saccharum]|nr:hypothetical protein Q3G72_004355 [Acer saccharum]